MKKTTKLAAILLTSLTVMTGCKGKRISGDEALEVLEDIIENCGKAYEDVKSFTVTSESKAEMDGEKVELETEVKYDHDRKAIYVNIDSSEDKEDIELYVGYDGDDVYAFDVLEKEYAVVEGELADAFFGEIFDVYAGITAQHQRNLVSSLTSIAMMVEAEKLEEGTLEKEGIDLDLFSSGKGNLVAEMKQEAEDGKAESTLKVKDYLITAESYEIETEDYSEKTETKVKYSAKVKLPSTSKYTKAEAGF